MSKPVNNFELIRPLLEFRTEDDFYFIQVLQRKKDFKDGQKVNGTNNNSRLVKAYYVNSIEYFDFIEKEVIQLCEVFNARAGINLNRRSYEKMALQHLKKITDQLINKSFNKAHKAYSSVVGSFMQESDKKWILDIDYKDIKGGGVELLHLNDCLEQCDPVGFKTIAEIPSRSGKHIITSPFNLKQFREFTDFSMIEIHKNNPTNLYIP